MALPLVSVLLSFMVGQSLSIDCFVGTDCVGDTFEAQDPKDCCLGVVGGFSFMSGICYNCTGMHTRYYTKPL